MRLIKSLIREEKGQGLVEYALIIALIAVVLILSLRDVRIAIANVFTRIQTGLGSTS